MINLHFLFCCSSDNKNRFHSSLSKLALSEASHINGDYNEALSNKIQAELDRSIAKHLEAGKLLQKNDASLIYIYSLFFFMFYLKKIYNFFSVLFVSASNYNVNKINRMVNVIYSYCPLISRHFVCAQCMVSTL